MGCERGQGAASGILPKQELSRLLQVPSTDKDCKIY